MRPELTVIEKQQVGDRTLWLAQDSSDMKWATYVSFEVNGNDTKHGHYFVNHDKAVHDFNERVKQYKESQTVRFIGWEF